MKNAILILLLFVSAISFSQESSVETPLIAIKIPLGETVQVVNHSITFKEVLEDSRCPIGVNCIWAGRAKISIEVSKEGEELIEKNLIFGETTQGESNSMLLFTENDSQVIGLKLNPYPNSEEQAENRSYVLLVYIKKLNWS